MKTYKKTKENEPATQGQTSQENGANNLSKNRVRKWFKKLNF